MAGQPQQRKLRIEFAAHHAFEVEFDIGGAAQAGIVAQDAQLQPVADQPPRVAPRAVEQFLHHAVRAALELRGDRAALVQRLAEGDQVDRRLLPHVTDRVSRAVVALKPAALKLQAAIAQFLKEHEQPALARQRGARVRLRQLAPLIVEAQPRAQAAVPCPVDRLVEPLARQKVIVFRAQPLDRAAIGDALQQVGGQQAAFSFDGGKGGSGYGLHVAITLC